VNNRSREVVLLGDGDISESIEIEPFEPTEVYKDGQVWIDSRMIHTFVENNRQYADWIKQRIEEIGAVEGADYLIHKFVKQVPHQGGFRNTEVINYLVTPDMAKELGMLERNAQGRATAVPGELAHWSKVPPPPPAVSQPREANPILPHRLPHGHLSRLI
jgi:phage anti-repressor protein